MEFIWTMALISYVSTIPNVQYVGRFPDEAACAKAASVTLPIGFNNTKVVCVQVSQPVTAPTAAPAKK